MTLGEALRTTERTLMEAGIESAAVDARILVAHAARVPRARLVLEPERPLSDDAALRASCYAARRVKHEPVALITRHRGFWTLELQVNRSTLVPRPDSETLVQAALDHCSDKNGAYRVLDLGTGTGCLLLAFLAERPNATGLGVDLSARAVKLARANARSAGLDTRAEFAVGDWGQGTEGRFDLILTNPPYVRDGEWAGLEEDVRLYEPKSALLAGADGLDAYRALIGDVARLLAADGIFLGEVGQGQAGAVATLLERSGLAVVDVRRDIGGIERCVSATLAKNAQAA